MPKWRMTYMPMDGAPIRYSCIVEADEQGYAELRARLLIAEMLEPKGAAHFTDFKGPLPLERVETEMLS